MEAKKKKLDSLAQELRNGPASDENAQKYEKLLTKASCKSAPFAMDIYENDCRKKR